MHGLLKRVGLAIGIALVAVLPARADTTPTGPNSGYLLSANDTTPIVIQGWSIVLGSCNITISGATATGCTSTDEVIPTVTSVPYGSELSLVFQNVTSGTPLLTGGSLASDINLPQIQVSGPATRQIVSTQSIVGTGSSAVARVSVSNTPTVNSVILAPVIANGSTTLASATFNPASKLSTQVDLRAGPSYTLTSAGLTFTAVPEPMSSSLLVVGIVGVEFMRRKKRRRA